MLEKLPSLQVSAWSTDFLRSVVNLVTGSLLREDSCEKDHVLYLRSYLGHLDVETVILEGSYVDQNYLEDFQKYYSSCFPHHPKCCTRLHFFSNKFDEAGFLKAINGDESSDKFISKLNENYLGYIVIRPIPETFIARLCLIPYKKIREDSNYHFITKQYEVNLFGITLTVESALFTEKDKVVSACATSSIWTLLCSSSHYDRNTYPSPSSITKEALSEGGPDQRGFPVLGLTPPQACRAIQQYGLEASYFPLPTNDTETCFQILKKYSVAYITNSIPFIVAGIVYSINKKTKKLTKIGDHAMCILGYHYSGSAPEGKCLSIDNLYAHDDRYGPYLALKFPEKDSASGRYPEYEVLSQPIIERRVDIKEAEIERRAPEKVTGFNISFDSSGKSSKCELIEIFVPSHIILAKQHKARISYNSAENLVKTFIKIVQFLQENNTNDSSIGPLDYELVLVGSNKLKKDCAARNAVYFMFNGNNDKSSFLCKSLPKHMWSCELYNKGALIGRILFDATEAIQGRPLIGYIAYDDAFNNLWVNLSKGSSYDVIHHRFIEFADKVQLNTFMIYLKFLKGEEKLFLNIIYGEPKIVQRRFKTTNEIPTPELTPCGSLFEKPNVKIIKYNSKWKPSDLDCNTQKYIWLIDQDGNFYYGVEDESNTEYCTGHPTLNDGRPSRLAGELTFDNVKNKWSINISSSSYSGHILSEEDIEVQKTRLEQVLKNNFTGWDKTELPSITTVPSRACLV